VDLINWIELAVLLAIIATGIIVWRVCKRKLKQKSGIVGIITERGKLPPRQPQDLDEEIAQLKAELGRK
jgi:hypothetical protein